MNTSGDPTVTVAATCGPPPWALSMLPMMHMDLLFAYTLLPFPVFIVEGEPPGCPGVGSPIRPTAMLLKNTFGLPLEITLAG
jgi:hypothetical protein